MVVAGLHGSDHLCLCKCSGTVFSRMVVEVHVLTLIALSAAWLLCVARLHGSDYYCLRIALVRLQFQAFAIMWAVQRHTAYILCKNKANRQGFGHIL